MPAVISPEVFASFAEELEVALRISASAGEVLVVYEDLSGDNGFAVYTSVPNSENVLVENIQPHQMEQYLSTITEVRDDTATVVTDEFDMT